MNEGDPAGSSGEGSGERSEAELDQALDRAQAGDGDGFEVLYQAYSEDVARLCRRILAPGPDAEDAANEAFLRARRGFARYDRKQPFRRWLLALTSNLCIDRIRRKQVEGRLFESDAGAEDALPGPAPSPLRMALQEEERRQLLAAIDTLPDRERTLLAMRHFAELSYPEIAETTGLPVERIGSQLHRARVRLRAAFLAQSGGTGR
ncbi:MAG: sigma-70 family RNA polymerase sigma factor [Myxococcota bacterium]|nr:sigma-70 family RNA polymerase sigma factor [Myxococcota bacterium]